jgi:hypothetical protein
MSRNYANIATTIWRNDDFRALSAGAQHMYLLLTSQPDISAAGVLPLSVTRWASRAKDTTRETVIGALQELQAHRFVVFDTETEELLVRSFVRWDGGYGNTKRQPVIKRAARDVESPVIRRALAAEFQRLGLPPEWLPDSLSASPSIAIPDTSPETGDSDDGDLAYSQVNSLSGTVSPSEGVVGTQGLLVDAPTHNPQSVPPSAGAASPSAGGKAKATPRRRKPPAGNEPVDPTAQAVVAAFIDGAREMGRIVTRDVIKQVGGTAKRLLADNEVPAEELIKSAREMGRRGWKDLNMQLLKGNESRASPVNRAHTAWQGPDLNTKPEDHYARPPIGGSS